MAYAAKRGIDVKIIMPHIPDKKYAYLLARTYYPELIASGVKIYEYEPGFTHAKIFVSDDEKATVGSINLISEACICILSVEPIYTETAQLQMWRRILRKRWKNAFQLH